MMRGTTWLAALLVAVAASTMPLFAQEDEELKKHPGYVDFSQLPIPTEGEEIVEVYIGGPLLRLVAKAAGEEGEGLARMLSKLLLVRVNTFGTDSVRALALQPQIAKIEQELARKRWEKVVRAKDRRGESAHVYLKMEGEKIVGLLVMAVEPGGEAAFVNIVGEIDMDAIGKMGKKLDIPALEGVKTSERPK
ncbi:MAG: DUF4252 domain-containing protein [bacterium]|jgi:hypothetical protein|nr:DUF4252 domain-containing protein [candidate division KSB1 bacterium]MDH7560440.1 DUF4252 domain-containing protein [bacterium]